MNNPNTQQPLDPAAERDYWRNRFQQESYYEAGSTYDDYEAAYQAGYESRGQHPGKNWEQAENEVEATWERTKGKSRLAWEKAKHAARAAWDRVERAMPGDADNDGR